MNGTAQNFDEVRIALAQEIVNQLNKRGKDLDVWEKRFFGEAVTYLVQNIQKMDVDDDAWLCASKTALEKACVSATDRAPGWDKPGADANAETLTYEQLLSDLTKLGAKVY